MYIISGFIGLCFGGFLSVYPALTADYFGSRYFSINYGLVFLGYGSGCFIGPLLGGYIYDITHSYLIAFKTAGALALLGGLLILFALAKPKKVYIQKI